MGASGPTSGGRALRFLAALLALAGPAAAQLTADFMASPTAGDNPLTVQFTDTTTGAPPPLSWLWDFGDGSGSSQQHPVHIYETPGSYTVSLFVVTLPLATDTEVKPDFIVVDVAPIVPDFTADPTAGTVALTVDFTDTSTSGVPTTAWTWDFGDGAASTEQHPSHTYTAAGTYDVSLTVSTATQLPETVSKPGLITVAAADPQPDFTAAPTQGFFSLAVDFTDMTTGGTATAWHWDFGDGTTGAGPTPEHVYTQRGTYTVTLTTSLGEQQGSITRPNAVAVAGVKWLEVARILASDGAALDLFGTTAVDEPYLLVGARLADDGDGETYVFDIRDPLAPVELGKLVPESPTSGFGSLVAIHGTTAVVRTSFGPAFVFDVTTREQLAELDVPSTFFPSLATDGARVLVGATSGCRLYDVATGALISTLDTDSSGFSFGSSVVLAGDIAYVGEPIAGDKGTVFVFDISDPADPLLVTQFAPAGVTSGDQFGTDLALDGDLLLAGSHRDDVDGEDAGSAFLFDVSDPSQPVELSRLTAGKTGGRFLGRNVDLRGPVALAGSANAPFLFDIADPLHPIPLAKPVASDGGGLSFGTPLDGLWSVLTDTHLFAGRLDDGELGINAGAVLVYEIVPRPWLEMSQGLAGTQGFSRLEGSGTLAPGSAFTLALADAAPLAPTVLFIGLSITAARFKGGVLVPSPDVRIDGATDGDGDLSLAGTVPVGIPSESSFFLQQWIVDPAGPQGMAASNALKATTP